MVTAEFAVAIPAILLVLAVVLSGIGFAADQVRCLDAARTAARSLGRGDPAAAALAQAHDVAPHGATITVSSGGDMVRVDVRGSPTALLSFVGLDLVPMGSASAINEATVRAP